MDVRHPYQSIFLPLVPDFKEPRLPKKYPQASQEQQNTKGNACEPVRKTHQVEKWSPDFGPVVKVDRIMREVIQNDERKNLSPEFKAKVALASILAEMTLAEFSNKVRCSRHPDRHVPTSSDGEYVDGFYAPGFDLRKGERGKSRQVAFQNWPLGVAGIFWPLSCM